MRCPGTTDHHSLFFLTRPDRAAFDHLAFEVRDGYSGLAPESLITLAHFFVSSPIVAAICAGVLAITS